ncbi:MAG: YggS family pyridoxal phosphate-dependent enzyme [Bacteroidota bacterium]
MLATIQQTLAQTNTQLVAVSKTKSNAQILEVYRAGVRHFGENRVQEVVDKYHQLPKDIHWHFIGHLQTNKVKYIAPFVHLIHSMDSPRIIQEVNKQAQKNDRVIEVLLQFKIAEEATKYGFDWETAVAFLQSPAFAEMNHVRIVGVMGMATFTSDETQVSQEFQTLRRFFLDLKADFFQHDDHFQEISMGMSGDYALAIKEGSTMVRIGSLIFGTR